MGDELHFVGVGGSGGGGGGGGAAADGDDATPDVGGTTSATSASSCRGRHIRVTEANKEEYASLLVEDYLVGAAREGIAALLKGAHDVLPRRVLHAEGLRAIDLELLVGGLPCIDVDDWRLNTGGTLMSDGEHAQLRDWFWRSVDGMDLERRAKLLAFACGTGRLPAAGFSALSPSSRWRSTAARRRTSRRRTRASTNLPARVRPVRDARPPAAHRHRAGRHGFL